MEGYKLLLTVLQFFGIVLCKIKNHPHGRSDVVLSFLGSTMSIIWIAVMLIFQIWTRFKNPNRLERIYRSDISWIGDIFFKLLKLSQFPAIMLPGWFFYRKRRKLLFKFIEAKKALDRLDASNEAKCSEWLRLGVILLLFILGVSYFAGSVYCMVIYYVVKKGIKKIDLGYTFIACIPYIYELLFLIDIGLTVVQIVKMFNMIQQKLLQLK